MIGNSHIDACYLGENEIDAKYLGSNLIYDKIIEAARLADCKLLLMPKRADGVSAGSNSPFTGRMVDLANSVGKNLFDGVLEIGTISSTTGVASAESTCVRSVNFIPIVPEATYRISNDKNYSNAYAFYDENKNFISFGGSFTFVPPSNARFMKIRSAAAQTPSQNDLTVKYQLELGSTATAYEPYRKNNAQLTNFAGTTSDGFVKLPILSKNGTPFNFINYLGTKWDFETDLVGLNVTGNSTISNEQHKTGAKSLKCITSSSSSFVFKDLPSTDGDKWYACVFAFLTSWSAGSSIGVSLHEYGAYTGIAYGNVNTSLINQWQFVSVEKTAVNGGVRLLVGQAAGSTAEGYYDCALAFNKTQIFGVGNEPTKDQMDIIVQKAVDTYGYINERVLKIAWMDFVATDGVDSYGLIQDNGSLNFVGTQDFAFAGIFVTPSTISAVQLFCRNESTSANIQYSISLATDGRLNLYINGSAINVSGAGKIKPNSLYAFKVSRINGVLKFTLNGEELYNQPNSADIVSKPFIRLLARSNDSSGLTHTAFFKGYTALIGAFGANVTEGSLSKFCDKAFAPYQP